MTSAEKIRQAIDQAESLADDETASFTIQAAGGMLAMARPTIEQLLPADASGLDEMLLAGARWFLSLRSDDASPAFVTTEP